MCLKVGGGGGDCSLAEVESDPASQEEAVAPQVRIGHRRETTDGATYVPAQAGGLPRLSSKGNSICCAGRFSK